MEQIDEASFLILNALYLRKIADRDVLAECSGCSAGDVDMILDRSSATGPRRWSATWRHWNRSASGYPATSTTPNGSAGASTGSTPARSSTSPAQRWTRSTTSGSSSTRTSSPSSAGPAKLSAAEGSGK